MQKAIALAFAAAAMAAAGFAGVTVQAATAPATVNRYHPEVRAFVPPNRTAMRIAEQRTAARANLQPLSAGDSQQKQHFYVSTRGSDANSGTSPEHPFRTISRCAQVMEPGDVCEIMGGTYREAVVPENSGTARAPITYEPYRNEAVTVTGTDVVTGWRRVPAAALPGLARANRDSFLPQSPFAAAVRAGHIYAATAALNPSLAGNELFYDGRRMVPAQWPWPGTHPLTPRIEYAQSGTTNTKIVDPKLTQPAGYWNGAGVYTEYWFVSQTATVARSAPGALDLKNLNEGSVGLVAGNTRYYLFGQLKMLSHAGEWFYDAASHTLYLWAPDGGSPAGHVVEAKQRAYAFDLANVSYTRVLGLHVFAATLRTGTTSRGDVFDHLNVQFPSAYQTLARFTTGIANSGVEVHGQDNTVENSVIAHSAGNGIGLFGSHNRVLDNVIYDVDTMGTYAAGINVVANYSSSTPNVGNDQTIVGNTIFRTGRSGIDLDDGTRYHGDHIARNNVYAFNRLNVDGGAIYACCNLNLSGTSFDHNWLHDATPMPDVAPFSEAGIYLDNRSHDALVYDDVGWNVPSSTVLINGTNGSSPGDLVYNNDGGVQLLGVSRSPGSKITNNIGGLQLNGSTASGATIANNLGASANPLYVNPADADYRLQADSPARGTGVFIPGITPHVLPSMGAYQYGAPFWRAGASGAPPTLVSVSAMPQVVSVGKTASLQVSGTMSNGGGANLSQALVTYRVDNPHIVRVNGKGIVTGLSSGVATITVDVVLNGFACIGTTEVVSLTGTLV